MKFTFRELGALNYGEMELKDLTIICGKNDTGKTYLSYALYGFFKNWENYLEIDVSRYIKQLKETGTSEINLDDLYKEQSEKIYKEATIYFVKSLPEILAGQKLRFKNTEIEIMEINNPNCLDALERKFDSGEEKEVIVFKKEKNSTVLNISVVLASDIAGRDFFPQQYLIENIIKHIIWDNLFPTPFIMSTERTGAITFKSEFSTPISVTTRDKERLKSFLANNAVGDGVSIRKFLKSITEAGYALAVSDNIEFFNKLERIQRKNSKLFEESPSIISDFEAIIGGKYLLKDGVVFFATKKGQFTMGESSSAVRSLVHLGYYLNHIASKGDILIIDEPELNLHPSNQRKLARLLAKLVNYGIKVFATTHSDYFVRELNTLIMLNNRTDKTNYIAKCYEYKQDEFLSIDKVNLYTIDEGTYFPKNKNKQADIFYEEPYETKGNILIKADIDSRLGIEVQTFDKDIHELNEIQDEIYYSFPD